MKTKFAGMANCFITSVDNYLGMINVYFSFNKLDRESVFEKFNNEVENETERKIEILKNKIMLRLCNKQLFRFLRDSCSWLCLHTKSVWHYRAHEWEFDEAQK